MNKNETKYDILISKYLDNDITQEEQFLLEEWVKDSKENEKYFSESAKIWEVSTIFSQDENLVKDKFEKLFEKINKNKQYKIVRNVLRASAAILVLFIAIQTFSTLAKKEKMATVITDSNKQEIILPDGSIVWLNANSSLSYNSQFKDGRKVVLKGEALFDVNQVNGKVFYVSTDDITVQVLGTRFLITSHEQTSQIETILESGRINLIINSTNEQIELKPNDKLIYNILDATFEMEIVNASDYTSWTDTSLVFENTNLENVFLQLEKYFNIEIQCENYTLMHTPVSFTLDDESIDEILDILKEITELTWKRNSDNLIMIE